MTCLSMVLNLISQSIYDKSATVIDKINILTKHRYSSVLMILFFSRLTLRVSELFLQNFVHMCMSKKNKPILLIFTRRQLNNNNILIYLTNKKYEITRC